eukprot:scaffold85048_cov36-Phaeocystis_antarctica.AAC.2
MKSAESISTSAHGLGRAFFCVSRDLPPSLPRTPHRNEEMNEALVTRCGRRKRVCCSINVRGRRDPEQREGGLEAGALDRPDSRHPTLKAAAR